MKDTAIYYYFKFAIARTNMQENAIYLIGTFNSFVQRQGTVQVSIEVAQ